MSRAIIPVVGFALWLGCGAAVFLIARIVPFGRRKAWLGELVVSLAAAVALGVLATALDFGGWREPDWRAAVFTLCGAFTAAGLIRLTISSIPPGGPSP